MSPSRSIGFAALLLAVAFVSGGASRPAAEARSQLGFGIDMARRGLWNEAVFRFEAARRLSPDNFRILNDLAVAYEAVGRFEDALEAYRAALKVEPGSRQAKQNYARFVEFYQSFRPKAAKPAVTEAQPSATPTATPTPAAPSSGS
ncbi:MAG: tetratricopeptide repeat protein [Holophagales bacterium]|nr:MAG: tetratricopeptide repeat protein [Holophagales bacterium]